jgi:cysteine desulfurase
MFGGSQQRGIRPGTLPVELYVGLGSACDFVSNIEKNAHYLSNMCDVFVNKLLDEGVVFEINGNRSKRTHGIINLMFNSIDGEKLIFNRLLHLMHLPVQEI